MLTERERLRYLIIVSLKGVRAMTMLQGIQRGCRKRQSLSSSGQTQPKQN
ncbi:MAG: hypothetical protein MJA27_17100 [Pseudanabaenales cyanobacterium]|nr:hypothetical protein [Pseudanabaenales cyanobacterium]